MKEEWKASSARPSRTVISGTGSYRTVSSEAGLLGEKPDTGVSEVPEQVMKPKRGRVLDKKANLNDGRTQFMFAAALNCSFCNTPTKTPVNQAKGAPFLPKYEDALANTGILAT